MRTCYQPSRTSEFASNSRTNAPEIELNSMHIHRLVYFEDIEVLDTNITLIFQHQSHLRRFLHVHYDFACDLDGAIGKMGTYLGVNQLICNIKRITMSKTMVMGKTWKAPGKLPGRRHIVLSRSARDDVEVLSFEEVLKLGESEEIMVIGGGESTIFWNTKEIHKTVIETIIEH